MFLVGMYKGYSAFGKIFHEMALSEQTLGDQLQKTAGFMERLAFFPIITEEILHVLHTYIRRKDSLIKQID